MAKIIVNNENKKSTIAPEIYGHFSEHLGRCIYEGLFVGENSDIPNVNGMRTDVVDALKEMKIPVLRRVKKTKRQKELSPAERRKNLEGAFALAKPGQMKYCRILLVDDIYTTGSTVDAIASLLKVNGAEQVDFVCAAIVK